MSSKFFFSRIFAVLSKYNVSMKTNSGYNYKIIFASVLFIVITAVKLLFPAQTEGIRARVREAVSRDADYTEVFESLGTRLSDGAERAAALLFGSERAVSASQPVAYEPTTLDDIRGEAEYLLVDSPEPAASVEPSPSPTPEPEPTPSETPASVSAFLESQAEFADYAVPANVSYDMPQLPFEFTSPVSGYTSSSTTAPTSQYTPARTSTPSPTAPWRSWAGMRAMATTSY